MPVLYSVNVPGPGSLDDNSRIVWWQLGDATPDFSVALKIAQEHRKFDEARVVASVM